MVWLAQSTRALEKRWDFSKMLFATSNRIEACNGSRTYQKSEKVFDVVG